MKDDKKTIILSVPGAVYDAVAAEAKRNGLTISGYLRALIGYGYKHELDYDQVTQSLFEPGCIPVS